MDTSRREWSAEAESLAVQAAVLSGNKLDQLVRRLQRQSGRSREACWRFVIQHGLKSRDEHRRWTEEEIELAREELTQHSVEEVAKRLKRTPPSLRAMLQRNHLSIREIRCDCFSIDSLARILHVRKAEIGAWIEKEWLQATVRPQGKRTAYFITPESFAALYRKHLQELLAERRIPHMSLFEAFYQYCYSPKHTQGTQLLVVRRDKRERAAYAEAIDSDGADDDEGDYQEKDGDEGPDEESTVFSGE
jgi:hypothetical protein